MEQAEADLWHEGSYLESMTWHCMNYLLIRYRTSEATCISYGQFDTSLILCLAPWCNVDNFPNDETSQVRLNGVLLLLIWQWGELGAKRKEASRFEFCGLPRQMFQNIDQSGNCEAVNTYQSWGFWATDSLTSSEDCQDPRYDKQPDICAPLGRFLPPKLVAHPLRCTNSHSKRRAFCLFCPLPPDRRGSVPWVLWLDCSLHHWAPGRG